MKQGFIYWLVGAVLTLPFAVSSQIVITEIMYDPPGVDTGREWIEIYNTSTSSVRLIDWKIYENGTNHKISTISSIDTIASNKYAIIAENVAKFSVDYSDFKGQIFRSAFSLGNSGDTIILRDSKLAEMNSATYTEIHATSGVGNSLQRDFIGKDAFTPHTPTPGAVITTDTIIPKVKDITPPKSARTKAVKKLGVSKKVISNNPYSSGVVDDLDIITDSVTPSQVASLGDVEVKSYSLWVMSVIALAIVASIGTFASRHVAKREWDIVEEKPEDM